MLFFFLLNNCMRCIRELNFSLEIAVQDPQRGLRLRVSRNLIIKTKIWKLDSWNTKSLFSILERLHLSDSVTFFNRLLLNVVTARGGLDLHTYRQSISTTFTTGYEWAFLILTSIYHIFFYICHEPDSLLNDQFLLFCTWAMVILDFISLEHWLMQQGVTAPKTEVLMRLT